MNPRTRVRTLGGAAMLAATFLSGPAGLVHAMPTLSASGQSTPVVRDHRGEAQQPRPPGPAAEPALAPEQRDPAARLQVVIKNIIIHDDRDWGEGDINIKVQIGRSQGALLVESTLPEFGANSGDTKLVNRIVPAAGDVMTDASIGSAIGFPVYAGETYQLAISGVDKDPIFDDDLGVLVVDINEQNGWGPIGSRTGRGTVGLGWTWGVFYGEGPGFGRGPAYFSVEYEIRRVPLPDFEPRIILRDTGDGQFYCVEVRNVGERPSGLFQVAVRADGTLLRAPTLPALEVNATTEHCVLRSELPAGEHLLSFRVDEARQIPEMNESNNLYEWRIPARSTSGLAPGSTPTRTSTPVLSGASTPTPANSPTTVTRTPTATPRPTSTSSQR